MEDRKELFERMPVAKALAKMALPTIISQLVTLIYNIADTFFIGRANNPRMTAAASLSFVLFFTLTALSNLFGIGGGSHISRLMGEGKIKEAKKVCVFSFYGSIALVLFYSAVVYIFRYPVLRMLGATEGTIAYAYQYILYVVIIGGLPGCLSMVMAHLLRSVGSAKLASRGLALGGILNIILDPIFMFVILEPGNEVAGAGMATMISNSVATLYFFMVFWKNRHSDILSFDPSVGGPSGASVRSVFSVGLPSTMGSLMGSISNGVINNLMSTHSDIAVAAMGIVKKIDMLPMKMSMGLCQAMVPLAAYNYSAKNYKRMHEFIRASRLAGVGFAAFCILVYTSFSKSLVSFFINDAETVRLGSSFLKIAVLATPLMITNIQMSYTFQAVGKGLRSLILTSSRQGLFNVPLLFTMNHFFGYYGIVSTQILADALTMIVSFTLFYWLKKEIRAEESLTE